MDDFRYCMVMARNDVEDAWIAEAPELPGCMVGGAMPAEAIANLETTVRVDRDRPPG